MITKVCLGCGQEKSVSEFYSSKWGDGFNSNCKVCRRVYQLAHYHKNANRMRFANQIYRETIGKDALHKKAAEFYKVNAEKIIKKSKEYRQKNLVMCLEKEAKRREENRDKTRESNRIGSVKYRLKKKSDPFYRLNTNIATAMWYSLKGQKSGLTWESLVEYTLQMLITHIESLWEPWMTWENYGRGKGKWVIDHIKPIVAFNFISYNDPEFKECWSLNNLRPLEDVKNCSKSGSYGGVRLYRKRSA